MKNKIKYLPLRFSYKHRNLRRDYIISENPTSYTNIKNGEYLIRGDKKNHSKSYYVVDNIWYLRSETTEDKGQSILIAANYQLFPSLRDNDWSELNKHYKRLSNYWKRAVDGRKHWMDLREIRRDVKKTFLKFDKNE